MNIHETNIFCPIPNDLLHLSIKREYGWEIAQVWSKGGEVPKNRGFNKNGYLNKNWYWIITQRIYAYSDFVSSFEMESKFRKTPENSTKEMFLS